MAIGRLLRTRGNRGELIAELDSNVPDREARLTEVKLQGGGAERVVRVEQTWRHAGRPVLKFQGIDSISEAEPWQGAEILAPEAETVVPGEGEYSYAALLGSRVVALDSGAAIGVVRGIEEYGGAPLLDVETADGRRVSIPFARSICKSIDVEAKRIGVELPEGLLDL